MEEEALDQCHTWIEALEPIESGHRIGSCSYVWQDQYVYMKNKSNGVVYYMKCWQSNCKATMVCRAATLVPVSFTPHNHPPQSNEVLTLRFRNELLETLRANPQESSSQIYDKLAADLRFKDVAKLVGRKRATKMMSRVKQTLIPKTKPKFSRRATKMMSRVRYTLIPKTEPKSRSGTRYYNATLSKKRANIQVNGGDIKQENQDGMLQENEEKILQKNEGDTLQENEDDMLEGNEDEMLEGNEDDMLERNEDDLLEENKDDQTMRQEEYNESNNDQLNRNNTLNSITATSEPVFSYNKESDVGELKNVVDKLEEISKRLYTVIRADTYEQFGKYIATLLRGLPKERAKRIMENIVSEVLSAKLGYEVQVQPTGKEAIFAEPLPECFEYDSTDTHIELTAENDVEVFHCQAKDQTTDNANIHEKPSATSKQDQQASNIPPLPRCSESGIRRYTAKPLTDNNNQRLETECVKTDSFKSATKQRKKINASKVRHSIAPASPISRSDHSTEPSVDNESLMCCISMVETVSEKTAQTLFKEDNSKHSTVPFERVSNEEVVHTAETEMTYQEVNDLPNSDSCAEQVVECSSESLMSYVMMGEDNSISEAEDVQFICTCRNIYLHSSCDLRKHFSSTHPGKTPCFNVKELSSEETSANKISQSIPSPECRTGSS